MYKDSVFDNLFVQYQDWLGDFESSSPSSWKDFIYNSLYKEIFMSEEDTCEISGKPLWDLLDYLTKSRVDDYGNPCPYSSKLEIAYINLKRILQKEDKNLLSKFYKRNSDNELGNYGYILYLYGITKFFGICEMLSEDSYFQEAGLDNFGCTYY